MASSTGMGQVFGSRLEPTMKEWDQVFGRVLSCRLFQRLRFEPTAPPKTEPREAPGMPVAYRLTEYPAG